MLRILAYLAVLLIGVGLFYQYFAAQRDEKKYPPPGDLIDVGGHKIHLLCQGEAGSGMPTVIIETGIWDSCQSWKLVQPEIATMTRVCTYDRAGYGWSERGPCPRTFEQIVRELKFLLEKKEIHPPYIFVGHSLGGAITRYYQSQYPNDIVGIVFVDAVHQEAPTFSNAFRVTSRAISFLSRFGVLRLVLKCFPPISANPQWTSAMQKTYAACHQTKRKAFNTCLDEWDGYDVSFETLRAEARSLKDIPVTVISRDLEKSIRPGMSKESIEKEKGKLERVIQQHQEDSPHARLVIADGSGHLVQLDRPDVIVAEIRRMIDYLSIGF